MKDAGVKSGGNEAKGASHHKDSGASAARSKGKKYKKETPKHASLEDALAAAMACKKCVATKSGTNGCSECMGDWFEEIRIKAAPRSYVVHID